jgi:hypothetical protein
MWGAASTDGHPEIFRIDPEIFRMDQSVASSIAGEIWPLPGLVPVACPVLVAGQR